jgi:superfamily II DNA or RNA helicase
MGYLIRPTIIMVGIHEPKIEVGGSYATVYNRLIVHNDYRNAKIVEKVNEAIGQGMRTLVTTSKSLEHIEILDELLRREGYSVAVLTGATTASERKRLVNAYKKGKVDVLLGTVLGEGVDIPEVECVVNAEGGKSDIRTMQRFRNLTTAPGKTRAVMYDFTDWTHKYLARHSLARFRAYRANEMFKIVVEDVK